MAAVSAPTPDQAADSLQKLSMDSQTKKLENTDSVKKSAAVKHGSVEGRDAKSHTNLLVERSTPPPLPDIVDPNMCYVPNAYASMYYGGFEGPVGEWGEEFPRYVGPDGGEMTPGVYGDNGSIMYPHGYGFAPYGAYPPPGSPVPATGHDGQLYGPQHYQFPPPYYQSPTPNASNQVPSTQAEVSTSVSAGQGPVSAENAKGTANGKFNGNNKGPPLATPTQLNMSENPNGAYGGVMPGGMPPTGYQDPRFGYDGVRSPVPWLDGAVYSDGQPRPVPNSSAASPVSNMSSARNQNVGPHSHFMGLHPPRPSSSMGSVHGYLNRMYANNRIYNCGSLVRSGHGFSPNGYDFRSNGRNWMYADRKYNRSRVRGNGSNVYGYENADGLDEKHRGPRSEPKSIKGFGPHVTIAVKGQSLPAGGKLTESASLHDREQYNKENFLVKYVEAKFFVIKSYSEDDVHKSIKYNVWASTPGGNKKLDAAYQESKEKSDDCPVFLFFSVNTSGQFVGLAEMVGSVDFSKTLDYWQQDKWNGCFPLKWHIVKDVPNNLLKHITLVNNDNKPVTNSRDTQQVNLEEGLEMLKIFKEHVSKTCMLDDFAFYEGREKLLQERKLKQQSQKQVTIYDGKATEVYNDEKMKLQKPLENGNAMVDRKIAENGVVMVSNTGDLAKGSKTVTEKSGGVNGVKGC